MKARTENAFTGKTAQKFADYADTVRGFVRYQLVQQNLGMHLGAEPLTIVDVGGGAAIDAVWLAELGHSVTIVEPAPEQIVLAQAKVAQLNPAIASRIATVQGTAETLLADGKAGTYDAVLSHGVAMYVDDARQFIAALAELLKPGGVLSLLEKGWAGAYTRVIAEQAYTAAGQLRHKNQFTNHMGKTVWAFQPKTLEEYMTHAGLTVVEWKGVRVAHDADYRPIADLGESERAAIVRVEQTLGTAPETRGMGQMLHFIAQK